MLFHRMNHPAAARSADVVPNDNLPNYQVHMNGVLPGHDAPVVAAILAPRFKQSVEQLEAILNGPMIVLKRGIDRQTAEQYVTALTRAGCACSMHKQIAAPAPVRLAKPVVAEQPASPEEPMAPDGPDLAMAAIGQKLCIDAIIISFVCAKALQESTLLGYLLGAIAMSALSVLGVVRIVNGLRLSTPMRTLNIFGALIPGLSLILLVILSVMVTRRVRAAGFKVGLFGVSADERAVIAGEAQGQEQYSRMPSVATVLAIVAICAAT